MIIPTYISPSDVLGGRLYADAFVNVAPEYSATATKYAIADKTVINNNVVKQNPLLNLSFFVGSHPLKSFNDSLIGYEELGQRASTTHELLLKWYQNSTQLFIHNEFYNFSNYVIVKYTPKQFEAYDTLQFDLTLEHLRHVSYSRSTLIQFMDNSKSIDATSKSNQGESSSKENIDNLSQKEKVLRIYGDEAGKLLNLIDKEETTNDN